MHVLLGQPSWPSMFVGQYGCHGRPDGVFEVKKLYSHQGHRRFITEKVEPVPQYRGLLGPKVGTVVQYCLQNYTQHFFTDKI